MYDSDDYEDLQDFLEDNKTNFYIKNNDDNDDIISYIENSEFGSTNVVGTWKDLD
jgi:hypothetical protein